MGRKAFVAVGILLFAQIAAAQVDWRWNKLTDSGTPGASWDYDFAIYSLAVSPDGNTVVVGGAGSGAARVFTRSGDQWSRQSDIPVASDATNAEVAPSSVAISAEGTVILGCPLDTIAGGAWVYTRTGDSWSQQGPRLGAAGVVGETYQGMAVGISADGNTAIVGGPYYESQQGAAWVFTRTAGVWLQQGSALRGTPRGAEQPFQGLSVAISADGNTAVLGGFGDSQGTSAAWVFTRSGGVWSQQGPLLSGSDAFMSRPNSCPVAISADGNTIVVGGPGDSNWIGAAWVFTRSNGVWSQQGPKLVGSGAEGQAEQGTSVAMSSDGNTVIVGGPGDDSGTGATWVFTRSGNAWSQKGVKLVGANAVGKADQGMSVAVSADGRTFATGGPLDDDTGAAWVFSNSPFAAWIPAAAHTAGLNQTSWRSDLGLLNISSATATVQLQFFGSDGVTSNTVQVAAGSQSILTDVVGQLGAEGQGAIEITTDQTLKVTARTYNQAPAEAGCFPNGTQGQAFPLLTPGGGLAAGQSAYLPGLVQNAAYRSNIGLVNTDDSPATVLVELFDGAGGKLADYTVTLAHGQWAQENRPFEKKAGVTALDRGYARVTVQSGSGVHAFASVIDNVTNDPTTVTMQR
jgi:WD40 repeat protein